MRRLAYAAVATALTYIGLAACAADSWSADSWS
jgi:hypothetical protein